MKQSWFSGKVRTWGVSIVLALVTVLSYWPVLHCDFVNYDDPEFVVKNSMVQQGLSWSTTVWAFSFGHGDYWRPLTWLSHLLDVSLFGLNPAGHHAVNLFWHVANTLLLFAVLKRMTGAIGRSAFVAALFALHPLHVESVAWIAERKDVLSTFFGLLAMAGYVHYALPKSTRSGESKDGKVRSPILSSPSFFYFLSLFFFACSLMSKPSLVTFPFILLLLDYWPLRREAFAAKFKMRKVAFAFLEKVPFLVLSVALSLITFIAQKKNNAISDISLGYRLGNAAISYLRYLGKMIWPNDLAVFYPYNFHWPTWQMAGAIVLLVVLSLLLLRAARSRPYLAVGWLWFVIVLVPLIGLVQAGTQSMADRYSYISLIGIFILLCWGLHDLCSRWRWNASMVGAGALVVLSLLAFATSVQVRYWRNGIVLFERTLAVTTNNGLAHNNLAAALMSAGKLAEAKPHLLAALAIRPDDPLALYNLGDLSARQNDPQNAERYFALLLQTNGKDNDARFNHALALQKLNRPEDAIAEYIETLRLNPDHVDAHVNVATVLARQGKGQEALPHGMAAVKLCPACPQAYYCVAIALFIQGKDAESIRAYEKALELCPKTPNNGSGENQAVFALAATPLSASIHNDLGNVLAREGRFQDAIAHYRLSLSIAPALTEARNNLAWILATCRDPAYRDGVEAVQRAQEICAAEPENLSYLDTLAAAYAAAARFDDAIATIQKAIASSESAGYAEMALRFRLRRQLYEKHQSYCVN